MKFTRGDPNITLGIIDGPIDLSHKAFDKVCITDLHNGRDCNCNDNSSQACAHGTFITGILAAKRGVCAPSIAPSCKYISRPIFSEDSIGGSKTSTKELANAIIETVNAKAKIINLSLGGINYINNITHLEDACIHAYNNGVIIVVAAGNQGRIGNLSIFNNGWVIPVSACDEYGLPLNQTNLGVYISKYGVMAPGYNIKSTFPNNKYDFMSGTSVAAALVTGSIALIWSIMPELKSTEIIYAIRKSSKSTSIIPSVLHIKDVMNILGKSLK